MRCLSTKFSLCKQISNGIFFYQLVFSTVAKRILLRINCLQFCCHKVHEAQILIGYTKLVFFLPDQIDTFITFTNLSKNAAHTVSFFFVSVFVAKFQQNVTVSAQKIEISTKDMRIRIKKFKTFNEVV